MVRQSLKFKTTNSFLHSDQVDVIQQLFLFCFSWPVALIPRKNSAVVSTPAGLLFSVSIFSDITGNVQQCARQGTVSWNSFLPSLRLVETV